MSLELWITISVVFGLVVGSFLNVVIGRLHAGESFLGGRSHCPHCRRTLKAWDLVPVLSFLFLGGKCRHCGKPISWQYPAVEILTAAVFGLAAAQSDFSSEMGIAVFLLALVLSALYIVIGVYDLKHFLILDKVLVFGVVVAAVYAAARGEFVFGLLGALCASGFFLAQYLASRGRWIGFGDVKFGVMLGLTAGFPVVIVMLFLAYMLGAFTGVGLIIMGKKDMGSRLPFGTFLAASAIICLYYGPAIAAWYGKLIGINW